ncbi:MAG: hypothetical protein D6807_00340 [Alphaproteobacteria bacterium]|nr:MAG: hypothetical protein D6807_00340 [Alphaproteobacteria bacterium]
MTLIETQALRLPRSLRDAVEELSKEEGSTPNEFIVIAVAEKVAALRTEAFLRTARQEPATNRGPGASEERDSEDRALDGEPDTAEAERGPWVPDKRYLAKVRMQNSAKGELALYFPHEMATDAGWKNGGPIIISFSDHPGERWVGTVTTESSHMPYLRTNVFSRENGSKRPVSDLLHRSKLQARDSVPCTIEGDGTVVLRTSEVKRRDNR